MLFFLFRRKAKVLFLVCQIILLKFPIDFGLKIHYSGIREGVCSIYSFLFFSFFFHFGLISIFYLSSSLHLLISYTFFEIFI